MDPIAEEKRISKKQRFLDRTDVEPHVVGPDLDKIFDPLRRFVKKHPRAAGATKALVDEFAEEE